MLKWRRGAYIHQVVHMPDCLGPSFIARNIADTPAGDAEGLRKAGNRDCAIIHSRQGRGTDMSSPVVQKVFVNLVSEDEQVMFLRRRGDQREFIGSKYLPRRV